MAMIFNATFQLNPYYVCVCVGFFSVLILVTAFMCVNAPNDEHLNDESMVHMEGKVRHADTKDRQHSPKVRMHHPMMMVELSDY